MINVWVKQDLIYPSQQELIDFATANPSTTAYLIKFASQPPPYKFTREELVDEVKKHITVYPGMKLLYDFGATSIHLRLTW